MFYMPMSFGRTITKMNQLVEKAGAKSLDWMTLSDHTSMWNMDLYLAVDKEIPNASNVTINGTFLSKVYEGPFSDTAKWCKDFKEYAKNLGHDEIKKWYMWYTTCPKCAKKYGKNYTVIIGQVG